MVIDIEDTMIQACRRVTKDRSVSKEERRRRANVLVKIGEYL